jgi:hypothetical protein
MYAEARMRSLADCRAVPGGQRVGATVVLEADLAS